VRPALSGDALRAALTEVHVALEEQGPVCEWFRAARTEADAWHTRRTAYLESRLAKGRHPDSDEGFWAEWDDGSPPPFPAGSLASPVALGALALLLLAGLWFVRRRRRASAHDG
jgi:LPXTG-motif cell wall-anchored protein